MVEMTAVICPRKLEVIETVSRRWAHYHFYETTSTEMMDGNPMGTPLYCPSLVEFSYSPASSLSSVITFGRYPNSVVTAKVFASRSLLPVLSGRPVDKANRLCHRSTFSEIHQLEVARWRRLL